MSDKYKKDYFKELLKDDVSLEEQITNLKSQLAEKVSEVDRKSKFIISMADRIGSLQAEVDELKKEKCLYVVLTNGLNQQLAQKDALVEEARPWVEWYKVKIEGLTMREEQIEEWLEITKAVK